MENQNPENQLNIELSEEIAEGIYSNSVGECVMIAKFE